MNHFQFNSLIKNIPSIDVSLDWDGQEGKAEVEDEEVQAGKFIVFTSFSCFETGIFDAGDWMTPPSFSSDGLDVDDVEALIYDEDGEEVTLTQRQKELLEIEIKSSVNSIC